MASLADGGERAVLLELRRLSKRGGTVVLPPAAQPTMVTPQPRLTGVRANYVVVDDPVRRHLDALERGLR